jgi:DNA-binding MarR family transcriptional regulator
MDLKNASFKVSELLDCFTGIDPSMPLMRIQVFLYICKREQEGRSGVLMTDIIDHFQLAQPVVWRHVQALATFSSITKAAAGILEVYKDDVDHRRGKIRLTPSGRELLEKLTSILEKDK